MYVCNRICWKRESHDFCEKAITFNLSIRNMKKMIILGAAIALVMSSCGAGSSIKSEQDSLAYALGMDLGNWLKSVDSTIDVAVVSNGIKDAMAGETKMDRDSAMNFIREYFYIRKPARTKAESEKFLQEVEANNKNVKKTASGLLYEIITPGDTIKPAVTDQVKVTYEGKLKNGKVFDSTFERGDTAQFALNQVISGWTEGLQLIGKGGKIKLWVPSELAYGPQGTGNGAIGPNEALVFEVELIDVIPVDTTATKK